MEPDGVEDEDPVVEDVPERGKDEQETPKYMVYRDPKKYSGDNTTKLCRKGQNLS